MSAARYAVSASVILLTSPLSSAAQIAQPALNPAPAGSHARISDATVLRERAARPDRPHSDPFGIALEEQAVAWAHSHEQPKLARYGNLSLAGDFGLRLH
jgi:hypothetical protein